MPTTRKLALLLSLAVWLRWIRPATAYSTSSVFDISGGSDWLYACRVVSINQTDCVGHQAPLFNVTSLTPTALLVLLENQAIPGAEHISSENLYESMNLDHLPDISGVGRDYYTLMYQYNLTAKMENITGKMNSEANYDILMQFEGINYRARAFVNGIQLQNAGDGMFHRHDYRIPFHRCRNSRQDCLFTIVIEPPLHPGVPIASSQGGNHALAMDGPVSQYQLGWDWCTSMPDRSTGFWGSRSMIIMQRHEVSSDDSQMVQLQDAAVETVDLECNNEICTSVHLRFRVTLKCWDCHASQSLLTLQVQADWGEVWELSGVYLQDGIQDLSTPGYVEVENPGLVRLWWPHGLGKPVAQLHSFSFSLTQARQRHNEEDIVLAIVRIPVGIRTIRAAFDNLLQGHLFYVNDARIYLTGGNWIGSDQALRISQERYCHELALHRYAGLNLVRVWGGGTAETDAFYQCADELGLLVYQEFWMTGDNNGRWAGKYSWPLNSEVYLENVAATVRRLRKHPSLLMYVGCNECWSNTSIPTPPRPIDDGIQQAIQQFDEESRFYIPSSMGGDNRSFSLAPKDGPYHPLLPANMFDINPGLANKSMRIGFQPEIGSVSAPTYRGLLRFMSPQEADEGVPDQNGDLSSAVWEFHRFQSWSFEEYDHVYAYINKNISQVNASEWCAAAQLAAHAQYQHLFGAFLAYMGQRTTAVLLWKSQSPWPSLRGFLYDWYMERTGTLRGARSVLQHPVSIILDLRSWRLRIVNKQLHPISKIRWSFEWINLKSHLVSGGSDQTTLRNLEPMSSSFLQSSIMPYPKECGNVCFLRLRWGDTLSYSSWQWLTDPHKGNKSDFSALGELRRTQGGQVQLDIIDCEHHIDGKQGWIWVTVQLLATSNDTVVFYPTFSLDNATSRKPLLPLYDNRETDVVLLPNERQERVVRAALGDKGKTTTSLSLSLHSWNAPSVHLPFSCFNTEVIKV